MYTLRVSGPHCLSWGPPVPPVPPRSAWGATFPTSWGLRWAGKHSGRVVVRSSAQGEGGRWGPGRQGLQLKGQWSGARWWMGALGRCQGRDRCGQV